MARYLITGVAGFIGSQLARELVSRGDEVRGVDNLSTGYLTNLTGINHQIDFIKGDVRNRGTLARACRGIDYVFHLAAIDPINPSPEEQLATQAVNMEATLRLLEAATKQNVKRIVFASAAAAYCGGPVHSPESGLTLPVMSPFGIHKLTCEQYLRNAWNEGQIETVSLRYFNVFGPGQRSDAGVIANFAHKMTSTPDPEQAPVVYGDGNQSRDFVYISDVVRASLLAMIAPKDAVAGRVFDVGSGTTQTVKAVYDSLAQLTGYNLSPTYQPPRRNDTAPPCADTASAQRAFCYTPEISFYDGLTQTVAWCRSPRINRGSAVSVGLVVPSSQPKTASKARADITRDLKEAIERQELRLDYQPILDLKSDQIVGAEALLRWRRGNEEFQPGSFIDIAASSGLLLPIGKWTMREACNQAAVFQRAIHPNFRVAVNVSPLQLEKKSFANTIEDALVQSGVRPKSLELEITEGIFMRDYAATQANLKRMKKLGVSIVVDDFGTGYANCNYLHRFPINRLKIDQSFVKPDLGRMQVLGAMVAFARTLRIPVTAEGVETDRHLVYARTNGCDEAQGFYIGRPMSPNALIRLCRTRQPKAPNPRSAIFNQPQIAERQEDSLKRLYL